MTRNGMSAGAAAVLALALAAVPARAFPDPEMEVARHLEQINKQLQDLRRDFDDLRRDLRDTSVSAGRSAGDLKSLEERVRHLEQTLQTQERRFSFSPEGPRTGIIRLHNRSPIGATILVDGTPYYVGAFETRTILERPVGAFNYEVLADGFGIIQPRVVRELRNREVFTINVTPGISSP